VAGIGLSGKSTELEFDDMTGATEPDEPES
jgi:hypothetical protein